MGKIGKGRRRKVLLHYFRDGEISPRALYHAAGALFYIMGFHTEYLFLRLARAVRAILRRVADTVLLFWALAGVTVIPLWNNIRRDLTAPWLQMHSGITNLRTFIRQERQAGRNVTGKGLQYLLNGFRVYKGLLGRAFSYLLPLASAAVFVLTVSTVLRYNFALRVEYGGQTLGFVANESVYEGAVNMVGQRIQGVDAGYDWRQTPVMTLTVVDKASLYDQSSLADKIISLSSETFQDATGVWLNGVMIGATADSQQVQDAINAALAPAKQAAEGLQAQVSFRQDIQLDPGLYFTKTLVSGQELTDRLTGLAPITLPSGEEIVWNVLAEVQTAVREVYVENYTLPEQTVANDQMDWGEERVVQEGAEGRRKVTAEVIYVDGVEVQRTVLESQDLVAPVQRIVEYGVNNVYGGSTGAVGDGNFIWPVPDYTYQSRGFIQYGSYVSHRGLDICASYGTPIVAADNGVVTFAGAGSGYNWSYGNFVQIDHGNGYSTLYGHMAAVAVQQGQYVAKGEVIGYVGSTGRSSGNHCHFEIERNDVLQNPAAYVTRP